MSWMHYAVVALVVLIAYWVGRLEERARMWVRVARLIAEADKHAFGDGASNMVFWTGWTRALEEVSGVTDIASRKPVAGLQGRQP